MHVQRENHAIAKLCAVLEVSRQGYYKWLDRTKVPTPTPTKQKRVRLLQRILEIFEESRETYGSPRIYDQLRLEGFSCGHNTVERLMRQHGISPRLKRKFRNTTDSNHDLPIAPNVLSREFIAEEPDEVWVSDITYIATGQGWLYLCVFVDLFSRMVVGWSLSSDMKAEFVVDAFQMGVGRRGRAPIVVHSDRGSQYASDMFRAELNHHDCIQSMSRRANCWDNAVAESWFATLKTELIFRNSYKSRIEASTAIFDYIEIFYNKRRRHSTLGFLAPEEKVQKGQKGRQATQSDCA